MNAIDRIKRNKVFEQTYMKMAIAAAGLSYCKKRQVGAVIVKGRNVIAYGFNGTISGMPNVCEDENNKTLPNVVHAEMNAVLKAGTQCRGADIYITLFPCQSCTLLMAQAGISRIFYLEDHKTDEHRLYGMVSIKVDLD